MKNSHGGEDLAPKLIQLVRSNKEMLIHEHRDTMNRYVKLFLAHRDSLDTARAPGNDLLIESTSMK